MMVMGIICYSIYTCLIHNQYMNLKNPNMSLE